MISVYLIIIINDILLSAYYYIKLMFGDGRS